MYICLPDQCIFRPGQEPVDSGSRNQSWELYLQVYICLDWYTYTYIYIYINVGIYINHLTSASSGQGKNQSIVGPEINPGNFRARIGNLGFSGLMHSTRCRLSRAQSMKYCFRLSCVCEIYGCDRCRRSCVRQESIVTSHVWKESVFRFQICNASTQWCVELAGTT